MQQKLIIYSSIASNVLRNTKAIPELVELMIHVRTGRSGHWWTGQQTKV